MKGGNTDSMSSEIQGFDYDGVDQYGLVSMKGGKKGKGKGKAKKISSSKFSDFDFAKEWKEFEESYNQKYGGAPKKKKSSSSTKKKPTKKASSSTKKKPTKKASSSTKKKSAKKPKGKTQRGGDESGATFAPANFFDANATMSSSSNDQSKSSLVDGLYPHSSNNATVDQTGGAKKKKGSTAKKTKTTTKTTKTTKPKKDKKDSKKDTKKTGKKVSVLDKIKKFFAM